ncbi:MAG: hypothetical protein J7D61_14030 [Marichromatium sp.]|nr:hypothetical protein [Marichromatium sp.]
MHDTTDAPNRQLIEDWTRLQTGTIEPERLARLDRDQPEWRCRAATLVAESLFAYITLEMVAPDLAYRHRDQPEHEPEAGEIDARLGAHLLDFLDYRDELAERRATAGAD